MSHKRICISITLLFLFCIIQSIAICETGDWVKEDGIRIPGAVSTCTISYNNKYYMYYTGGGANGIGLAISDDGLNFTNYGTIVSNGNPGDPDEGAHDPTIIRLSDGRLRMFYSGERQNYGGYSRYIVICTAISSDGINFTKEGVILTPDDTDDGQMSVPEAILLSNGELWIYYTYGFYTENSLRAARYTGPSMEIGDLQNLDNWQRIDLNGFERNSMDPDLIVLSENPLRLWLFFALGVEEQEGPPIPIICSAVSSDGVNWTIESGARVTPTKAEEGVGVGDPDVIYIGESYRMYYYGMPQGDPQDILSALSPEEEAGISTTIITGKVYDSSTSSNISGVIVKLYNSNGTFIASTTLNPYTFTVNSGTNCYLRVAKEGYTFPSIKVDTKVNGDHGEVFTATGSSMTIDIPVDQGYPLEITKTANKKKVTIGEIVTYNISIKNKTILPIENIVLLDKINNGFKYISGSSYLDGTKTQDPTISSPARFTIGTIGASSTRNISYQIRVSTGVVPGNYESSAVAKETIYNWQMSNESEVVVWIVLDPIFDTGTIVGKVFLDVNENGIQDGPEEKGITGVRIATEYGIVVETDRDGKYHIPNIQPGVHLIKVDPNSLPEGSKITTDNPYVVRVSTGLLSKVSFGVKLTEEAPKLGPQDSKFFIVALADGIIRNLDTSGNIEMVEKDDRFDEGLNVDGRIAYYLKGKIKGKYLITSSFDSDRLPDKRRQRWDNVSLKKLFSNLDPDKYYPIYGDASVIDYSAADTQDAFYLLVEWDESYLKWGSFNTEIPLYNRTLSGGKIEYKSLCKTKYGDTKTHLKGFYAVSRQIPAHDEFLGTGGSLYYLRHRDIIEGSEKLRVEVRDRISKVLIQAYELIEGIDYEIDYDTGRIILKKPLNSVNNRYTSTIISNDILSGERVYLVIDYEYFSENGLSNDSWGGKLSQWIGNHVRIGGTYVKEQREGLDPYELAGGDGTLKINEDTEIDVNYNHSKETQLGSDISWDGGFTFTERGTTSSDDKSGSALGISGKTKLNLLGETDITLSYLRQDTNFSATDSLTTQGTQKYLASILSRLNENLAVGITHTTQELLDTTTAQTISGNSKTHTTTAFADFQKNKWDVRLEYQNQEVKNPVTDYTWFGQSFLDDNNFIAARLGYQLTEKLHPYLRGQGTLSGETNNQGTLGLDILVFKDTTINIAETLGNNGNSTLLGIVSRVCEDTDIYTNLEVGNIQEQGKFTKTSYGQSTALDKKGSKIYAQTDYSSFNENILQGNVIGYDKKITDSLGIGLTYERAQLDKPNNAIDRNSGSVSLSYLDVDFLKLYSKLELREDKGNNLKRRQWLTSNDATWYLTQDISILGRANWALTEDKINDLDEARFHEMGAGLAYRPINFDKLSLLAKYSYITDLPPDIQYDFVESTESLKHIYSIEGAYDLCKYIQLVGKFAYRDMEEKVGPRDWTSSDTMLYIGRFNFHISNLLTDDTRSFIARGWDLGLEYRTLSNDDSDDKKTGWLVELDKELFKYAMIGVGYNFTDYDDDLSNSDDYDAKGWFVRLLGKY